MLRCQHLVDVSLADGEPPLFERGVADEVKPRVIMCHFAVETEGLKRFSQVESIDQGLDTKQQTAGSLCDLVTLVGLHKGLPADPLHDRKCRRFLQFVEIVPNVLQEEAILACFQTCELQDAVEGIAVVRDARRAASNGVRQFCGLLLLLREALKVPPLFAGKTVVTD